MFVIDVIPLSRTAPGTLTYRSKDELLPGTIVNITIRKTATQGIVIESIPVTHAKEMLKNARFLLSRSVPSTAGMIPPEILQAAQKTAAYHATSVGAVLTAVFAEHIRSGVPLPTRGLVHGEGFVRTTIELPLSTRAQKYKEHIATTTSNGKATLFIVPTIPELLYWKDVFAELKPVVLSGTVAGTRRAHSLEQASSHRGLVIATPSFSWVPIECLGSIIIDRVSAGTYTLQKRPYLSMPYALEALSQARAIPLILGDYPLPLEYRTAGGITTTSPSPIVLFDARRERPEEKDSQRDDTSGPWRAIPEAIVERIRTELSRTGRVIMLATRKGYAPGVMCRDCGQAQTDERGVPLSFSQAHGKRVFITSDGKTSIDAARACTRCGSWNLLPLGVGIERVEEEMRQEFPHASVIVIPAEALSSPRKARAVIAEASKPSSIVIGTEALLPWLYACDNASGKPLGIIASADSLLALPFWRSRERFVRLSYFFSGLCREVVLITRRPEDSAVQAVVDSKNEAFWTEEHLLRKALLYPPYGTLIALTVEGTEEAASLFADRMLTMLAAYHPSILASRPVTLRAVRKTVVITLPANDWPNAELTSSIRTLPPHIRVRIDPESF